MTDSRTRLARWGAFAARHPWRIVVAWILITVAAFAVAVAGVGGGSLFSRLTSGAPVVDGEARDGTDILRSASPTGQSLLLQVQGVDLSAPEVAQAARQNAERVEQIPGVAQVVSPFVVPGGPGSAPALAYVGGGSLDSGGFLTVVTFDRDLSSPERDATASQVEAAFDEISSDLPDGATASVGGEGPLTEDILDQVEFDLRVGEGVALPLSFVVMVVVFGGFLAAGMPIAGAIASIGGGLAALYAFSYVLDLDASVVNVVTLLGLALCIDYGLLTVSRMREELRALARGRPAADLTAAEIESATSRTVARAGRTVLFSGLTVAISLSGLLVIRAEIIRAVGAAGVSVVLIAMVVALTLVPALCALGARRVLGKGTEIAPDEGIFSRLAGAVGRRAWFVLSACVALLVVLSIPTLSMQLTSSGHQLLPVGASQRDFFDRLAAEYPLVSEPDVTVVAAGDAASVERWVSSSVATLPGVTSATVRPVSDGVSSVGIRVDDGPLGDTTRQVVSTLRSERPDVDTWVTGQAAHLADFSQVVRDGAPLAIGLVALATFVLMFLMTGSVVLPTKTLILNVLSLGAALGVTTWVFQQGHLQGLLGFDSVGAIESLIPPLVLALGFGLAMDYQLFLISRVSELYHHDKLDNDAAVRLGLQRSGRIITSAALLVVIVFAGFLAGKILVIKEVGFALTIAVLLDASIVRMLLVPAAMHILGRRNWWAPAPLARWHAEHGVRE